MAIPRPDGGPTIMPEPTMPATPARTTSPGGIARRALVTTTKRRRAGSFVGAPLTELNSAGYQVPTPSPVAATPSAPSPYGYGTPPVNAPSTSPLPGGLDSWLASLTGFGTMQGLASAALGQLGRR